MPAQVKLKDRRQAFLGFILRSLGRAYRWGGDDPLAGFDCSGFIVEGLQEAGLLHHRADLSAEDLRLLYLDMEILEPEAGALLFYQQTPAGRAYHVEVFVNHWQIAGAIGGTSETETLADAIRQNAYIMLRPWDYRAAGVKTILDPFRDNGG